MAMSRRLVVVALLLGVGAVLPPAGAAAGAGSVDPVCPPAQPHRATCFTQAIGPRLGPSGSLSRPSGFSPATVKKVYGFSTAARAGKGQVIAIVIPFHHPDAESHLSAFSKRFGLQPCRAVAGNPTNINGCFVYVFATGVQPATNADWAIEADLDAQWAHAIAPGARLFLVEAASDSLADLFLATAVAASLPGVRYVSMSWGSPEFLGENGFDVFLQQVGVSYFAASGDSVVPVYPSASSRVISVGATTLKVRADRRRTETAWASSGGGCSAFVAAHPAQAAFVQYAQTGCGGLRSTPDVAVVGDPQTGVSVYTSVGGVTGWQVLGGTSGATPIVAGAAATTSRQVDATLLYGVPASFFFDITAGQPSCLVGFDTCSGRGSFAGPRWW
jgi:subtilase family serine protease